MVSFSCVQCGDILKKPKVKTHMERCWTSGFSCVDCNANFDTVSVNAHNQCVSETQRYAGKWLEKQAKQKKERQESAREAGREAKRKRSPVKELSSPEWSDDDSEEPKKKKQAKPSPKPSAAAPSPASTPAAKAKASPAAAPSEAKDKKTVSVTATADGISLSLQLKKKQAEKARGSDEKVRKLLREAAVALIDSKIGELAASVSL